MLPTSLELCAGAGGQALGVARAGFRHLAVVEVNPDACETLRTNRPRWNVVETDIRTFSARRFRGRLDLIAAGLPCQPFTVAGDGRGRFDERDMFPAALRIIREARPRAIMIENVPGFLTDKFARYRRRIRRKLEKLGYAVAWRQLNAADFGVPQSRERVIIVAMKSDAMAAFEWPQEDGEATETVGEAIGDLMAEGGWKGARRWMRRADRTAPTIVGGSSNRGGADLGPSGTRKAWLGLGVNGKSLAEAPPHLGFRGEPRLTLPMIARLQGFPDWWQFEGKKTSAYRQIGNALPPALARAVAKQIKLALKQASRRTPTCDKVAASRHPRRAGIGSRTSMPDKAAGRLQFPFMPI